MPVLQILPSLRKHTICQNWGLQDAIFDDNPVALPHSSATSQGFSKGREGRGREGRWRQGRKGRWFVSVEGRRRRWRWMGRGKGMGKREVSKRTTKVAEVGDIVRSVDLHNWCKWIRKMEVRLVVAIADL